MRENASFIVLESDAYRKLIDDVMEIALEVSKNLKSNDWINEDAAKELLGVSSKSTLQRFRDEDRIKFSMVTPKNIQYSRKSILNYLESKSNI